MWVVCVCWIHQGGVLLLTHVDDRCNVVPLVAGTGRDIRVVPARKVADRGGRTEASSQPAARPPAASWAALDPGQAVRPSARHRHTSGRDQSDETQDSVFPYDRVPGGAGHADAALGRSSDWTAGPTGRLGSLRGRADLADFTGLTGTRDDRT